MAEIRHLENRHDVIFFCWGWSDLDKISETGAEWHVDCGGAVEIVTRCIIPIWRAFGRIQWHVIPEYLPHCRVLPPFEFNVMISEPRITLQAAATWWIHCHDSRATYATLQGVRIPSAIILKIVFRHKLILFFSFLMQFRLWRAAAFVSSPIHLFNHGWHKRTLRFFQTGISRVRVRSPRDKLGHESWSQKSTSL